MPARPRLCRPCAATRASTVNGDVSLLCSALYVLIIYCFVCEVSLLYSALYAKRPDSLCSSSCISIAIVIHPVMLYLLRVGVGDW